MHIDLSGSNILLTGASRGIGAEIARQLHASGATLALHYGRSRDEAQALANELGARVHLVQGNLEDPEAVTGVWQAALNALGRIDVLVNNAGTSILSSIDEDVATWTAAWQRTMNINLLASGILSKHFIEHTLAGHEAGLPSGGRLINIASRAAFRGDTADYIAYAASKGGVVAMTRSIARAFGKQGVKAFNIAPGWVMTDMAKEFMDAGGEETVLSELALPTLTQPSDVAPTIVLLASGLADHATGCTIDINAASYVH